MFYNKSQVTEVMNHYGETGHVYFGPIALDYDGNWGWAHNLQPLTEMSSDVWGPGQPGDNSGGFDCTDIYFNTDRNQYEGENTECHHYDFKFICVELTSTVCESTTTTSTTTTVESTTTTTSTTTTVESTTTSTTTTISSPPTTDSTPLVPASNSTNSSLPSTTMTMSPVDSTSSVQAVGATIVQIIYMECTTKSSAYKVNDVFMSLYLLCLHLHLHKLIESTNHHNVIFFNYI